MQELRRSGLEPALLPEAEVASMIADLRKEWLSQPDQKKSFDDLVGRLSLTRDRAIRTMKIRFRSMVKDKFGGILWLQVLISTGSIPNRILELANLQIGQKALEQKYKAPASSPVPASAGVPTGSQHRVSLAKRQRHETNKMTKDVREETEKRSYGNRDEWMSDADCARLQHDAKRTFKRARVLSQARGHAYKLDGQSYGAPEASNFAILLADYCGELDINVATGFPNRRATLRKR